MTSNKLEQEAKFWISHPQKLESRLESLSADRIQERTYELNLRFDTADLRLSNVFQVLRLRQDKKCHLTFKGPSDPQRSISAREEIEVEISDLPTAQKILEALGFQVSVIYEKYRSVYMLDDVEVSLDEMPFGNFSEIEGPDESHIHSTADQLGLDWEARSRLSYLAIFSTLKNEYSLTMDDLTFEAFSGINLSLEKIGLRIAD